ncbi:MAG TPA: hypothetical protein VI643_06505 [Planctomycetota bacterium]|nr:hypothetical protein [Planctomycetota bacterium]
MAQRILWNSPAIPGELVEDEGFHVAVRDKLAEIVESDSPSRSDLRAIFVRYNDSSPGERDAIDAAFVWITGYTFSTLCAKVTTSRGQTYEQTLNQWRGQRGE